MKIEFDLDELEKICEALDYVAFEYNDEKAKKISTKITYELSGELNRRIKNNGT